MDPQTLNLLILFLFIGKKDMDKRLLLLLLACGGSLLSAQPPTTYTMGTTATSATPAAPCQPLTYTPPTPSPYGAAPSLMPILLFFLLSKGPISDEFRGGAG